MDKREYNPSGVVEMAVVTRVVRNIHGAEVEWEERDYVKARWKEEDLTAWAKLYKLTGRRYGKYVPRYVTIGQDGDGKGTAHNVPVGYNGSEWYYVNTYQCVHRTHRELLQYVCRKVEDEIEIALAKKDRKGCEV
jgi:hypothetical protein